MHSAKLHWFIPQVGFLMRKLEIYAKYPIAYIQFFAQCTLVSDVGSTMDATLLRMSQRPPPRFSAGTDLVLWLSRFELYVRLAKIPEDQVTGELLSLLDDGPFRVVSRTTFSTTSTPLLHIFFLAWPIEPHLNLFQCFLNS